MGGEGRFGGTAMHAWQHHSTHDGLRSMPDKQNSALQHSPTLADLKSSGRSTPSRSTGPSTAAARLCKPWDTPVTASASRAPAACTRSSVGRVTASASAALTPTRMAGPEACLQEGSPLVQSMDGAVPSELSRTRQQNGSRGHPRAASLHHTASAHPPEQEAKRLGRQRSHVLRAVVPQPLAGLQGGGRNSIWKLMVGAVQSEVQNRDNPSWVPVAESCCPETMPPGEIPHPPAQLRPAPPHLEQRQQLRLAGQQLAQVLADERQAGKQVLQLLRLPLQACAKLQEWQPAGQAQRRTRAPPSAMPPVQPIPASCTAAATEHQLHPAGPPPQPPAPNPVHQVGQGSAQQMVAVCKQHQPAAENGTHLRPPRQPGQ